MTDEVLRAQLIAVRAQLDAARATIDACLVILEPQAQQAPQEIEGGPNCTHPEEKIVENDTLAGRGQKCLACGAEWGL